MKTIVTSYVLVILVGLLGACQPQESKPSFLDKAQAAYDEGRYDLARQYATLFMARADVKPNERCEGLYLRGSAIREFGASFYGQARVDLQAVLVRQCTPELAGLAQTALGHMAFEDGRHDYAACEEYYREALAVLKKEPPRDAVLYRLGVSLQRMGRWSEADEVFERCRKEFRESLYAQRAADRIGSRRFVIQIGAFASQSHAGNEVRRVQDSGRTAGVVLVRDESGGMLHAVRTGSFTVYAGALREQAALQQAFPDAMIVTAPY